ncbi:MAG: hypothetical protein AB7O50_10225 [Pseudolabrys sp.]
MTDHSHHRHTDHHHHHPGHAHPPAPVAMSLLRMSVTQRLGIAAALIALLWIGVTWAALS